MTMGAPKGPLRDSLRIVSRLMMPSVSGVAGSSETRMSVRRRKAVELRLACIAMDAGNVLARAAPAGHLEAEVAQPFGRVLRP